MTETETTTINPDIEAERARALELAGRKELAVERAGEVSLAATGGIDFATLKDLHTAAGWLCKAGPMLPPWLQSNHGGMFGICLKAHELGISPLALANWSYLVENKGVQRVAYESQFFHAVIESKNGPLKTRLNYEIIGEGDERRCKVWATFKGEIEPRVFLSDTLGNLRPGRNQYGSIKGSPLWETKPELQLFYNASRDFARVYCPDVLAGMYGRDEMEDYKDSFQGPQNAKDVTPKVAAERRAISTAASQEALSTIDAALDDAMMQPETVAAPAKNKKKAAAKSLSDDAAVEGEAATAVSNAAVLERSNSDTAATDQSVDTSDAPLAPE